MNIAKMEDIRWVHRILLPDGRTTPGKWPMNLKEYGLDKINFKNKRVLDVGCLDGAYTFFAEKKGAKKVVSIDINEEQFGEQKYTDENWSQGYLFCHKKLKSKAKYVFPYSLYDLTKENFGEFDIILYLGVNYHLAHPILALEILNSVLEKNGTLVFESEVSESFTRFYHRNKTRHLHENSVDINFDFSYYAKALRQTFLKPDSFLHLILSKLRHILWIFLSFILYDKKEVYKSDHSNFWIMDNLTIERILDYTGFQIVRKIQIPMASRTTYIVKKTRNIDSTYGYVSQYTNYKKRVTNIKNFKG